MAGIVPPFTAATAHQKVKAGQNLWNTQDPARVALAYTETCTWRNRSSFVQGREQIIALLTAKWAREHNYRLRKELFAFRENRIAVQFWYEYQDVQDGMRWKRCYGIEHWTFEEDGRMGKRHMSGNDVLLGRDGDGVGVSAEENGGVEVEGRWFVDGVDVDDEAVTEQLTKKHF